MGHCVSSDPCMPKRKKSRKRKKDLLGPKLGKIWPNFVERFAPEMMVAFGKCLAPIWYKLWVIWGCLWHNLGGGFDTKSHCSVSSSNVLQCILLFNFGVNLGPRDWENYSGVFGKFVKTFTVGQSRLPTSQALGHHLHLGMMWVHYALRCR